MSDSAIAPFLIPIDQDTITGYLIVMVAIPLGFGIIFGREWRSKNPTKLGFAWGYFSILNSALTATFVLFVGGVQSAEKGTLGISLVAMLMLLATWRLFVWAYSRRLFALVALTVLSLNPLIIVPNIYYLWHRRHEFAREAAERQANSTNLRPR